MLAGQLALLSRVLGRGRLTRLLPLRNGTLMGAVRFFANLLFLNLRNSCNFLLFVVLRADRLL